MSDKNQGAFLTSLKRNVEKIKEARANAIAGDAEKAYRRKIEDMHDLMDRLGRQQEDMLDMSPNDAQSLVLGKDFDAVAFINKDIEISKQLLDLGDQVAFAEARYKHLFGDKK